MAQFYGLEERLCEENYSGRHRELVALCRLRCDNCTNNAAPKRHDRHAKPILTIHGH